MSLFCCLCSKACSDREALETHLGVEHFDYYPFACSYCMQNNAQAKFSTKDAIRRHCVQDHGLKKFHIRLWMSEEIDNDEQEIQKCIEKSMRINQNTAILPSPVFQSSQSQPMIEFPSGSSTSGSQVDERSLLVSVQDNSFCTNTSILQAVEMHTEDRKLGNGVQKSGLLQLEDDGSDCKKRLHKSGSTLTGDSLPTIASENFRFSMPAGQPRGHERSPNGITRQMAIVPTKSSHSVINQDKNVAKKTPSPNIEPQMASTLRRQAFLNATYRHTSTDLVEASTPGVNPKVRCSICELLVTDLRVNLRTHINTAHIRFPLFSCKECDVHFYGRRNSIVEHMRTFHKQDESLIIDRLSIYEPILSQRMAEFFPTSTAIHLKPFARRRRRPVKAQPKRPTPSIINASVVNHTTRPSTMSAANFSAPPNSNFSSQTSEHLIHKEIPECSSSSNANNNPVAKPAAVRPVLRRKGKSRRKMVLNGIKKVRCLSSFTPDFAKAIFGENCKKKSVQCSKCFTKIQGRFDYLLFNHMNINHLKLPVFECRGCGETFQEYSGLSISSHMKSHHKGNTSFIQDNRPIYREPLQEACLEFFASKS